MNVSGPKVPSDNPEHFLEAPRSEQDELCKLCQEVDLLETFYQEGPYIWDEPINTPPERTLKHIKSHQNCPFCRLTLSAFHGSDLLAQTDRDDSLISAIVTSSGSLSLYSSVRDMGSPSSRLSSLICHLWFTTAVPYTRLNRTTDDYDWALGDSFQIHPLISLPGPYLDWKDRAMNTYRHARLVKRQIPFDLVRSWLDYCEQNHPHQTPGPKSRDLRDHEHVQIRLIDVKDMRLIETDTSSRYIALSYVWGTSNSFTLMKNNIASLSEVHGLSQIKIPQTIFDAIDVCSKLGERYIWVDSLCIQQDEDEKLEQIQNMEKIYLNAIMTIANISTFHKGADDPLPGLRPYSRQPFQEVHIISDVPVVVSRSYPQSLLKKTSAWNTRAWTMQEEVLSPRVLYFADTHCWFQCEACYFSEDTILESIIETDGGAPPVQHIFSKADSESGIRQGYIPSYAEDESWIRVSCLNEEVKPTVARSISQVFAQIEQYSARRTSLPSDALRAVSGLLQHSSSSFDMSGIGLDKTMTAYFYGHPVYTFDFSLCWVEDRHDPSKRRKGFPSWSWAGWFHAIRFPMGKADFAALGGFTEASSLCSRATLKHEREIFDYNLQAKRSLNELTDAFGIHVAPNVPLHQPALVKPSMYEQNNLLQLNTNDSSLVFYTSWAKLRIGSQPVEMTIRDFLQFDDCYTLTSPGTEQTSLGLMRLDKTWRDAQSETLELDFIVVRATPCMKFEPYFHSSSTADAANSSPPGDWGLSLMCIIWLDAEKSQSTGKRRAERFTVPIMTRNKSSRDGFDLPDAKTWMNMDPKPVEVLVELV